MRCVVDTNVFIRILTEDHPEHALKALNLLKKASEGELTLFVSDVCLAEIAWTLESFYKLGRADVAEKLMALLNTKGLVFSSRNVLTDAVARYQLYSVDFADAYHAAIAAEMDTDVYTYDRDFDRFPDIKRLNPM